MKTITTIFYCLIAAMTYSQSIFDYELSVEELAESIKITVSDSVLQGTCTEVLSIDTGFYVMLENNPALVRKEPIKLDEFNVYVWDVLHFMNNGDPDVRITRLSSSGLGIYTEMVSTLYKKNCLIRSYVAFLVNEKGERSMSLESLEVGYFEIKKIEQNAR